MRGVYDLNVHNRDEQVGNYGSLISRFRTKDKIKTDPRTKTTQSGAI